LQNECHTPGGAGIGPNPPYRIKSRRRGTSFGPSQQSLPHFTRGRVLVELGFNYYDTGLIWIAPTACAGWLATWGDMVWPHDLI
jgi:hypothetical protein